MQQQQYENHKQIVYNYYLFTGVPILLLIGIAIGKIISNASNDLGWILLLIGWILLTLLFRSRAFALKAQDRAIRAEEGLRYFILTGKRLDERLTIKQIIALRFASDEELALLAQKAADEGLSNNAIKKKIRNWRADYYRIEIAEANKENVSYGRSFSETAMTNCRRFDHRDELSAFNSLSGLLTNHSVDAYFTRPGDQQHYKAGEEQSSQFAFAVKVAAVGPKKCNSHGNDQWYTGEAGEQPKYDKSSTEKFGKDQQ